MATASIRTTAMTRLSSVITTELNDSTVLVDLGWQAPEAREEQILIVGCEQDFGDHRIPAMSSATRGPRDDTFEIVVYLETKLPGKTATQAATRLEALWAAVENAIAKRKTLATTPGGTGLDGVVHAIVRRFSGPEFAATDQGHWARGEARVEVKSRLS